MADRPDDFGGATLDASDASLAPRTPGTVRVGGHGPDYEELLAVDPKHYVLSNELARGGMGRIVRAHDRRLGRNVAIKELLPGHDDLRFEREARITARLQHPAIVAIHEAGKWPGGEPFFAMKLVAGESLDKKINATSTLAERLSLVPAVATAVDALAYAHSERVIHRDLKPANILVGDFGETVVIDWGLAKDLSSSATDDVSVGPYRGNNAGETVVGSVMGTPAYMPPEQADGAAVDERADVYALGALLYHVLAGEAPYHGKTTDEVLARVLEAPPTLLQTRAPDVPIELVAICDKAMAREVKDRFPTAKEMADELRRFQNGQLVKSHEYTFGELVARWFKKYRAPIIVGSIAIVTLGIFGVASIRKILTETDRADRAAAIATERADRGTLERATAALATDPSQAVATLQELSPGAPEWRAAHTIVADAEARGVARILHGDGDAVTELVFSDDGAYLAGISNSVIVVWDLATGVKARLVEPDAERIRTIAWQGHDVLHVDFSGAFGRWHPFAGGNEALGTYDFDIVSLSPDGARIAYANRRGDYTVKVLATGETRSVGTFYRDYAQWFDATTIGGIRRDTEKLVRIDVKTGAETAEKLDVTSEIRNLVRAGGHTFAVFYPNRVEEAGVGPVSTGHTAEITLMAAMPDGRIVTACGLSPMTIGSPDAVDEQSDQVITVSSPVEMSTFGGKHQQQDYQRLVGHHSAITALAVGRAGTIASADSHGDVRVWHRTPIAATRGPGPLSTAFLDASRTVLFAHHNEDYVIRTDLASGATKILDEDRADVVDWHHGELAHLGYAETRLVHAHAAKATRWIARDNDKRFWVWDPVRGGHKLSTTTDTGIIAIAGDGAFAAADVETSLVLFDLVTYAPIRLDEHEPNAIAFSDDGEVLAYVIDSKISIYRPRAHTTDAFEMPSAVISQIALSPDGSQVAVATEFVIELVDLATKKITRTLTGHQSQLISVAYTSDGRLISVARDHAMKIWNLADGTAHTMQLSGRPMAIDVVGDRVLTTTDDAVVKLWDITSETGRTLLEHDRKPIYGGFTSDGTVLAVDDDGRISRYRDSVPWDEAGLRTWIAALTNL